MSGEAWGRVKGIVSRADSALAVQGQRLGIYVGRGRGVREGATRRAGLSFLPSLSSFVGWAALCCCLGFCWSREGSGAALSCGLFLLQSSGWRAPGPQKLGPRALEPRLCVDFRAQLLHACGIFPDQGSDPALLHWQLDSLPLSRQSLTRQALNTPAEHFFFHSAEYLWRAYCVLSP